MLKYKLLFCSHLNGRVGIEVIAIDLDHAKNTSNFAEENVVEVKAVSCTSFLPQDDFDLHIFIRNWVLAIQNR
jgi:hypothetical protein